MNDLGAQLRRVEVVANEETSTDGSPLNRTVGIVPTVERITT